jgi:hypothetical protein
MKLVYAEDKWDAYNLAEAVNRLEEVVRLSSEISWTMP